MERDKLMDTFIREKNSFVVAIEALKNGKVIWRSGSCQKYLRREVKYPDRTDIQYGNYIGDTKFRDDIYFKLEDVLADDWIINEKNQ